MQRWLCLVVVGQHALCSGYILEIEWHRFCVVGACARMCVWQVLQVAASLHRVRFKDVPELASFGKHGNFYGRQLGRLAKVSAMQVGLEVQCIVTCAVALPWYRAPIFAVSCGVTSRHCAMALEFICWTVYARVCCGLPQVQKGAPEIEGFAEMLAVLQRYPVVDKVSCVALLPRIAPTPPNAHKFHVTPHLTHERLVPSSQNVTAR